MRKKTYFTFGAIVLALLAIITGFCFVFFGNKVIKDVPTSLEVQKIEDDFYLVAQYNNQHNYKFKIEQLLEDEYLTVAVVESKTNTLKLSDCNLSVVAGDVYRFSVCFATENGAGDGNFSEELIWQPSWQLASVNYENVVFDSDNFKLSWNEIYNADNYIINIVDKYGNLNSKTVVSNSVGLENLNVGKYQVYIVATSSNPYLSQSLAGSGIEIKIEKENVIVQVERNLDNSLSLTTTQEVDAFEIYVNGQIKGEIKNVIASKNGTLFEYEIAEVSVVLNDVDFENAFVQIKSLQKDFVFESALVEII